MSNAFKKLHARWVLWCNNICLTHLVKKGYYGCPTCRNIKEIEKNKKYFAQKNKTARRVEIAKDVLIGN